MKSDLSGRHIRAMRKEMRVSRAAMAKGIGVAERTVYDWEHKDASVPQWAAMALAAWMYGLPPLPVEAALAKRRVT